MHRKTMSDTEELNLSVLMKKLRHRDVAIFSTRCRKYITLNFHHFPLCRLARFLRMSAFILAAPDPCKPVM
jgi:hypothetical protein